MRRPGWDVRLLLALLPRDEDGEVVAGDILETAPDGAGPALRFHLMASLAAIWSHRLERALRRTKGAALAGLRIELASALRLFRRRPTLALAVTGSIALGVAATISGMTLAEGVLHRSLPFPDPPHLVRISLESEGAERITELSGPVLATLDRLSELAEVTPVARVRMVIPGEGGGYRLRGEAVGSAYAELLGPRMILGRFPVGGDFAGGAPSRIVLSEGIWRARFGGDESIVGTAIRSDAAVHEVVGVVGQEFFGTTPEDLIDFWVPLRAWVDHETVEPERMLADPDTRWLRAVARLHGAPATPAGRTVGELRPAAGIPDGATVRATPLAEEWLSAARPPLRLLLAAAVCLLLLAGVNVTALMGARLLERRHDLAVRLALGASRRLVMRGLVIEAMVLAFAGAAAGALLALVAGEAVAMLLLTNLADWVTLPTGFGPRIGPATVATAGAASLALGLVAALVPPLLIRQGSFRISLNRVRGIGASLPTRLLNGAQIALATVLLLGTGLLLRSYGELSRVHPGFRTAGILRMQVTAAPGSYPTLDSRRLLNRETLTAVRSQPGVGEVVLVGPSAPPFAPIQGTLSIAGAAAAPLAVDFHSVSEGFFGVMEIPLVAGLDLDDIGTTSAGVVVVSRALADRLGGPRSALGRTTLFNLPGEEPTPLEIVGVAEDVLYTGVADRRPAPLDVYVPMEHWPRAFYSVLIEYGDGDLYRMLPTLRRALGSVDPAAAIHWVERLDVVLGNEAEGVRRRAALIGMIAGLALAMAGLGLYGMLLYSGRRRRGEFAIRQALGASPGALGRMVLADGLVSVAAGLIAGLVAAVFFVRIIRSFLYGVAPVDLETIGAVSVILALMGLVAASGPARLASRGDVGLVLGEGEG